MFRTLNLIEVYFSDPNSIYILLWTLRTAKKLSYCKIILKLLVSITASYGKKDKEGKRWCGISALKRGEIFWSNLAINFRRCVCVCVREREREILVCGFHWKGVNGWILNFCLKIFRFSKSPILESLLEPKIQAFRGVRTNSRIYAQLFNVYFFKNGWCQQKPIDVMNLTTIVR